MVTTAVCSGLGTAVRFCKRALVSSTYAADNVSCGGRSPAGASTGLALRPRLLFVARPGLALPHGSDGASLSDRRAPPTHGRPGGACSRTWPAIRGHRSAQWRARERSSSRSPRAHRSNARLVKPGLASSHDDRFGGVTNGSASAGRDARSRFEPPSPMVSPGRVRRPTAWSQ